MCGTRACRLLADDFRIIQLTTKKTVRAILDRLPDECSIDDVLYQRYVVQAVARGDADVAAGRTMSHEQVDADLRRKWLLGAGR
jgi:hypothetical protein